MKPEKRKVSEKTEDLRVLLFRERGWWVAQCLEYDINAQGKNVNDTIYEFLRTFFGHLIACSENGIDLHYSTPPAPQKYLEMFRSAMGLETEPLRFQVPPSVPQPFIESHPVVRLSA